MREIVLPSGRFAAFRPLTWRDRVATWGIASIEERVIALACRAVTIDGELLTLEQALDMELEEAEPIIQAICQNVLAGIKSQGVA
jgi:uncharacterized linocin/CFP29 family protein